MKITDTFTYTSKFGTSYENCHFVDATYDNGNKYLGIENDEEGSICVCSVNAERINAEDEIGIKDYSENEGMANYLIGMGIIEKNPVAYEESGWVVIPYFKLTESGKELFK